MRPLQLDHMTTPAQELAAVLLESTEHIEGAVKGLRDMKHAEGISERCTK